MGCTQSSPEELNKNERLGIGHTERLISADMQRAKLKQSKTAATLVDETDEGSPKLDSNGKLLPEEIQSRTICSKGVSSITVGNKEKGQNCSTIQYAYRTQRGFYPDNLKKPNQDMHGITLTLCGDGDDPLFAMYDGHGTEGHDCAAYAERQLPKSLAKFIKQKRAKLHVSNLKREGKSTKGAWNPKIWPLLDEKNFEECCRMAYLDTNKLMHNDQNLNSELSGTTAVTVCFHAGRMTVCNVGDSRVVLGHRESQENKKNSSSDEGEEESSETKQSKLIAIPLTRDQTPYRKDERDRVRKLGAEIKTIDQLKGLEPYHEDWGDMVLGERVDIQGDPPRVWVQGKQYPGTAFTRSLGDDTAEKIGVIAEPEIITTSLTVHDEYLIIASDGIFEFLTNDKVLKICQASSNPVEACENLTNAACDQWLEHEHRTDDITVIVCFLSSSHQPESGETGTTKDLTKTLNGIYGSRPSIDKTPQSDD